MHLYQSFANTKIEKLGHLLDELKISLFDTIPNLVNILLPKTFRKFS